jgi:hypothetical protein
VEPTGAQVHDRPPLGAALEGDLQHFPPSEVLQFLQLCGATGRIELEREGERAELFLEYGRPVLARTSRGSVRLGEILTHRRIVTRQTVERALALQHERPRERLGVLMVRECGVDREQVTRAIGEAMRRVLFGILLWQGGRFRFGPGERTGPDELVPDIELDQIILEGLRIADEVHGRR